MSEASSKVLMRTADGGRWVWWPALYVVHYIPKGKRRPTFRYPVRFTEIPDELTAYQAIGKADAERTS